MDWVKKAAAIRISSYPAANSATTRPGKLIHNWLEIFDLRGSVCAGFTGRFAVSVAQVSASRLEVYETLLAMVRLLVDHPEQVEISAVETRQRTSFCIRSNQQDVGKLIGKQGRTARQPLVTSDAPTDVESERRSVDSHVRTYEKVRCRQTMPNTARAELTHSSANLPLRITPSGRLLIPLIRSIRELIHTCYA
jgi:predicted RNA-binding protein YlqC (UPF0109 family)